jgi:hypothetical protein
MWCLPATIRSADSTPADERAALESALELAGPQLYRHVPIVLIAELPEMVSPDAEAWTVYDEHGTGDRIFVYTRSRTFRCASASRQDQDHFQPNAGRSKTEGSDGVYHAGSDADAVAPTFSRD